LVENGDAYDTAANRLAHDYQDPNEDREWATDAIDEVIEEYAAIQVIANAVAGSGIIPVSTKRFLMPEGDSITAGWGTSNNQSYANLYVPNASPKLTGVDYAVTVNTLQNIIDRDNGLNINQCLANKRSGDVYIYSILCGTNDLVYGFSGSDGTQAGFLTLYASWLDSLRTAGWHVVTSANISGISVRPL
jgi:hypothetical protein